MQYMGGKYALAKRIVKAIMDDSPGREHWFEPFVGGGSVLQNAAPHFARLTAMDAHEDLILMWQAVNAGWEPPPFVNREEHQALRHAEPSALRGFAGFGASFGGKWFSGYGVSSTKGEMCRISRRSVVKQGIVFRSHQISFVHGEFGSHEPPGGSTVYCDPPYIGTEGYGAHSLNHDQFYKTLLEWSSIGCQVYVSEYTPPIGVPYELIWAQETRATMAKANNRLAAVEHLYRVG
jgi:DNA adenine methylase